MANCCYRDEYAKLFTEREAARTARRCRRKGLSGAAGELADALVAYGIDGASVLEVGGGVGHLHTSLLRSGASSATNVDLSPSWEREAHALLAELGLEDRVERRVGDVVDEAASLPEADVVVLHRVVCCYPDWRAMVDAVLPRARRLIAMTLPAERWWNRTMVAGENLLSRLRGNAFRAYVHPVGEILARVGDAGFEVTYDHHRVVWRTLVFERTPGSRRRAGAEREVWQPARPRAAGPPAAWPDRTTRS